jgi:alpha-beta hydrolase superfamily lysophospholipase
MITAQDGINLYTKQWIPPQYKAVILLIHGFGEHINRYDHVANFFNQNGFAVVGMDTRGHGQSEGQRGHAPSFDTFMNDIALFIGETEKQFKGIPTFLYGHSMGGNLVLNYTIRRTPKVQGVVATGPWIQTAFKPNPIMVGLGKMMRSLVPTFSQPTGLVQAHISKDPSVVAAYKADSLVFDKMSSAAGIGMLEAANYLNQYIGEMPVPILIMHGDEDKITSQPASEAFANRVKGDITYKKWHNMYHEIHNEPDKQRVFDYTLGWLDSKL